MSAQCWRWAVFCAMKAGDEAESWYRQAVEAGEVSAISQLKRSYSKESNQRRTPKSPVGTPSFSPESTLSA